MNGILDNLGIAPFYLFILVFILQIVFIVLYILMNSKYKQLQKWKVIIKRQEL